MREIKFRAWDKEDFKIRKVLGMSFVHGAISVELNNEKYLQDYVSRFELMQYTGVQYIDGIEIYEGDIVKGHYVERGIKNRFIGQVRFVMGCFIVDGVKQYKHERQELNPLYKPIGNIYENPEILGDSQ